MQLSENINDSIYSKQTSPALMGAFMCLALWLRLWHLGARSLWVDELKIFERIPDLHPSIFVEPYFNPPLIYFIVRFWMAFGESEIFLRILPALAGALTILPVYGFARRLLTEPAARLGTFLFVISPFHIYYSQEINTYAFAALFASLAQLYYIRLVKGEQALWIWFSYGLSLTLGLFTHTYIVFLAAAQFLALFFIWRDQKSAWKKWLITYLALGLVYLPRLIPLLVTLSPGGGADQWTSLISPRLLTLKTAVPAVAAMFYSYVLGMTVEPVLSALLLIFLSLGACALTVGLTLRLLSQPAIRFLWLTFTLPLLCALIISMTWTPVYSSETPRYSLFFLPAFLILLARGLLLANSFWRRGCLVVLVIAAGFSLYNYYYRYSQVGMGDYRAVAAFIKSTQKDGGVVIHTSKPSPSPNRKVATASRRPINHYLGERWKSHVVLTDSDWAAQRVQLIENDRLWVVYFNDTSMWQIFLSELGRFTPSLTMPQWSRELAGLNYRQVAFEKFPGRKFVAVTCFERPGS